MYTTLIQAEELQGLLAAKAPVVIVDCRHDLAHPDAGISLYREGHVPTAFFAHMDNDLSGPHRQTGDGRHPWPQPGDFLGTLQDWNVQASTQVVAYDAGHGAFAARLWFLLRALGHEAVAVLDGGFARWTSLQLPVSTKLSDTEPMDHTAEVIDASAAPVWHRPNFIENLLCDADAVSKRLQRGRLLIDARAANRFRGEDETIDRKAGHVPGAVNRPYTDNLAEDGRFKPAAVLRQEFERILDGRSPSEAIVMCGSGVTATHHLLAMGIAGLDGAALFKGSWSGWIEDDRHPIAVGEEAKIPS